MVLAIAYVQVVGLLIASVRVLGPRLTAFERIADLAGCHRITPEHHAPVASHLFLFLPVVIISMLPGMPRVTYSFKVVSAQIHRFK